MGTFFSVLLEILGIIVIIAFGAMVVVIVAELILKLLDGGKRDTSNTDKEEKENRVVKSDDIVVYSSTENPNNITNEVVEKKSDTLDGDKIEEIDYDKAIEEQKMLQSKQGVVTAQQQPAPKPVETAPVNDDIFWDDDGDDEFNKLLDEVVEEAKKSGEEKIKKEEVVDTKADDEAKAKEDAEKAKKAELDAATQKELDDLKALKEQHQKEIDEFRQLKEDFAREKEEQLAMMQDNLNKAKEEELEKIREEALKEQEKLAKMQEELEEEKSALAEEKERIKEEKAQPEKEVAEGELEPIIKETIIKDEEELNRLKYKNLMRMNNRLTRIIRDTERLQNQKQKSQEKQEEEKQKLLAKQEQEKLKEQEKQIELERQEQEKQRKALEAEQKRMEIERKLQEASKKASKYKLDSKVVKISKGSPQVETQQDEIAVVEVEPLRPTAKPLFDKEYYETRIVELEEELKEAEKELRVNKSEYIPLTRIHKAYARDGEKLRKKEMQVAKQKVALYGVNSKNVDPAKKEKLDENLRVLAELKDSVQHCEEVIKKNKDRYPILEKNNKLITKHIQRINDDMKVCEKAIEYYKKNN